MNALIKIVTKLGLLKENVDYHLVRASMVLIFLLFGYKNGSSTKRRRWSRSSATAR